MKWIWILSKNGRYLSAAHNLSIRADLNGNVFGGGCFGGGGTTYVQQPAADVAPYEMSEEEKELLKMQSGMMRTIMPGMERMIGTMMPLEEQRMRQQLEGVMPLEQRMMEMQLQQLETAQPELLQYMKDMLPAERQRALQQLQFTSGVLGGGAPTRDYGPKEGMAYPGVIPEEGMQWQYDAEGGRTEVPIGGTGGMGGGLPGIYGMIGQRIGVPGINVPGIDIPNIDIAGKISSLRGAEDILEEQAMGRATGAVESEMNRLGILTSGTTGEMLQREYSDIAEMRAKREREDLWRGFEAQIGEEQMYRQLGLGESQMQRQLGLGEAGMQRGMDINQQMAQRASLANLVNLAMGQGMGAMPMANQQMGQAGQMTGQVGYMGTPMAQQMIPGLQQGIYGSGQAQRQYELQAALQGRPSYGYAQQGGGLGSMLGGMGGSALGGWMSPGGWWG